LMSVPHQPEDNSGPESIIAEKLAKAYRGRWVVDGVDLTVRQGEVVGLLGPNGAGKTTTFYMLVGLTRPNSGKVWLGGRDVTRLPMYLRARGGIGYLAQEPSIFRRLTVEENILAVLELLGMPKAERKQRVEELMERLDVADLRHHVGVTLSGGERRRVEIARTLATSPRFILLDEPFTGVDPIAVQDIQQIVQKLRSDNIGILITDHSVRETLEITDRAYIMYAGKILTAGSSADLPNDPIAREFYLGERFSQ